jgi:DNA-binding response OmpR family regulator
MGIQAEGALPLKGKKVLIADSQERARASLRDLLTSLGATAVVHVRSASEALRCVRAERIDIILCDYHLEDARDGQLLLEELRHERLISPAAIFMMITGERTFRKVLSVTEFAPDDYLIKPFTTNQLLDRLLKACRKKDVFAKAYACMEGGHAAAALPECMAIAAAHPEYANDANRCMVDILLGLQRHAEAESLIQVILRRKPVPWARMALANVLYAEGRLADAETMLERLAASNPQYLGAQDLLAQVKADLNQPREALEVLERAASLSPDNVKRLRHAAALAARAGDHDKSARLYGRLLERTRESPLAQGEDYIALSDSLMAQGKHAEVERVCAYQRQGMRGVPEAELVNHLMTHQRFSRLPGEDAQNRARDAVEAALSARGRLRAAPSAAIEFDLYNACLAAQLDDAGMALGRGLLGRADLTPRLRERIESELVRQGALGRSAGPIVPLDQVLAMLGKLSAQGWNDALAAACDASIAHWSENGADDPRLQQARERMAEVLGRFGMDATRARMQAGS